MPKKNVFTKPMVQQWQYPAPSQTRPKELDNNLLKTDWKEFVLFWYWNVVDSRLDKFTKGKI